MKGLKLASEAGEKVPADVKETLFALKKTATEVKWSSKKIALNIAS